MVLEFDQIKSFIEKPPHQDDILQLRKQHSKLLMHVDGIGVQQYLAQIEGYENKEQRELREKFAKSNKHVFGRLLRPVDKIFSAKGGSTFFNLPDKSRSSFDNTLQNIKNGQSLRIWLKKNWKPKFFTDANGLIFIEVDQDGNAYPTYKCIKSILDYQLNGIIPEYVIFEKSSKEELKSMGIEKEDGVDYHRVVDDDWDYLIRRQDDEFQVVKDHTYINHFQTVPAVVCSDIPNANSNYYVSPISEAIELADEYLIDQSIHTIYKFKHGFPLFWQYVKDCPECDGTGMKEGEKCPMCKGSGKKLKSDVSDIIGLELPEADETPIAPNVAGYVQPSIEVSREQREEMEYIYRGMHFLIWGTHSKEEEGNETATGRFIDVQPVNDRLNEFSDTAENIEKALVDMFGYFYHESAYKGSSVNYGRRYMIEPPDMILKKYLEARKEKASASTLNHLYMQYLQTEFENQMMEMALYTKLMKVEPFFHQSMTELKELELVGLSDIYGKIYFNEWLNTFSNQNDIIFTPVNGLKDQLKTFIEEKIKSLQITKTEENGTEH